MRLTHSPRVADGFCTLTSSCKTNVKQSHTSDYYCAPTHHHHIDFACRFHIAISLYYVLIFIYLFDCHEPDAAGPARRQCFLRSIRTVCHGFRGWTIAFPLVWVVISPSDLFNVACGRRRCSIFKSPSPNSQ